LQANFGIGSGEIINEFSDISSDKIEFDFSLVFIFGFNSINGIDCGVSSFGRKAFIVCEDLNLSFGELFIVGKQLVKSVESFLLQVNESLFFFDLFLVVFKEFQLGKGVLFNMEVFDFVDQDSGVNDLRCNLGKLLGLFGGNQNIINSSVFFVEQIDNSVNSIIQIF